MYGLYTIEQLVMLENFVQEHMPVSLKKRDKVKLRERLVEGSGSFVGDDVEGVVAACAAHAHELPQSVQEVVRT